VQHAITPTARRFGTRAAFAALTAALLAAALGGILEHGTGWWQFFAFGAGPDIALFLGLGAGLEKGRRHPRAVRLYNDLHSYWGPIALAALSIGLPAGYLIGALAWASHISLDRALGYGKRTRDGFQRS
jgi:hypothetical protein